MPTHFTVDPHNIRLVAGRFDVRDQTRISPLYPRVGHPLSDAEVAQARHFEAILCTEIAHLEGLARFSPRDWMGPHERRTGDPGPPEECVQLHARIEEAHRLLETLQRRFPLARRSEDPPNVQEERR
jgi:hypothetical protein